jgi:hypothetical protein
MDEWLITGWSDTLEVTVTTHDPTNDAPNAPDIQGQIQGKPGVIYEYTFIATDPDGDDLYYNICWEGCSGETQTIGPYTSGEAAVVSYSWTAQGNYVICAKAEDVYGVEGPEGTLSITMPLNKNSGGNQIMQRIRNRICDMLGICQGGCNLTELTGLLEYDGNNFFIGDIELHFGPPWYITSAQSAEDYDGDGTYELIIDELLGLEGTQVTIQGHIQSQDWMSVFTINGMVYREPGQPIWAAQHQWRWRHGHGNGNGGP